MSSGTALQVVLQAHPRRGARRLRRRPARRRFGRSKLEPADRHLHHGGRIGGCGRRLAAFRRCCGGGGRGRCARVDRRPCGGVGRFSPRRDAARHVGDRRAGLLGCGGQRRQGHGRSVRPRRCGADGGHCGGDRMDRRRPFGRRRSRSFAWRRSNALRCRLRNFPRSILDRWRVGDLADDRRPALFLRACIDTCTRRPHGRRKALLSPLLRHRRRPRARRRRRQGLVLAGRSGLRHGCVQRIHSLETRQGTRPDEGPGLDESRGETIEVAHHDSTSAR